MRIVFLIFIFCQVGLAQEQNNFYGASPLPGARKAVARGEAPQIYNVEEGDNLYDICDQLIGDGNYWPKLWSMNPDIANPHFIFPGMQLAFYSGDESNPPLLQVVNEEDMIPVDKGDLKEEELVQHRARIQERQSIISEMVNTDAPPEVVGPAQIMVGQDILDNLIVAGGTFGGGDVPITVPAFLFASRPEKLAKIRTDRIGPTMAGDDKMVLADSYEPLTDKATYTILRPAEKVYHPITGRFVGYRYDFVANMKVDGSLDDDMFVGRIFQARTGVLEDDIVVPFVSTKRMIPWNVNVDSPSPNGAVVIATETNETYASGAGRLVFLNKEPGISVGQSYPLFQPPNKRYMDYDEGARTAKYGERIGVVTIIDVTGEAALGYVVHAKREVRVGDRLNRG